MGTLNLPSPGWMTEDVVLLEEQVRRFIAAEYVPRLETWNEQGMYDREVWIKAGAAGLLCPAIPEQYGGAGGTFAHEAVIIRELSLAGFDSFGAPLHSGIVAPYILHYGTEEQRRRWLPRLVTGELVGAIAMSEPGTGSDLQGVRTTARKSGNGYVLNGSKTFITNGQHANLIIVVAKTDPSAGAKGVSLMVVETDSSPGFRRYLGNVLRRREAAAREPPGQRRRPGLCTIDERSSARAAHSRDSCTSNDRTGAGAHDRICQAASGLRQDDHRIPEHPVRACRMQIRGDNCARLSRPLHRALPQRCARHRDCLHGEVLDHRFARKDH